MNPQYARVTLGDGVLFAFTAAVVGDYLYHDNSYFLKQQIKSKFEVLSTRPLQFNQNVEKLEYNLHSQNDFIPKTRIVIGPNGCGKTVALKKFIEIQNLQNKRKAILVDMVDPDDEFSDKYVSVTRAIYKSLGIEERASYLFYFLAWIKAFEFADFDVVENKVAKQRLFEAVQLLYTVTKELNEENKTRILAEAKQKGISISIEQLNEEARVLLIFNHLEQLVKNHSTIKQSGGLSLLSTFAWLATENIENTNTYLAGNHNIQFLDNLKRSTFNNVPAEIITLTDPSIDRMQTELQKLEYTDKEIAGILSVFGTRLSDLTYFLNTLLSKRVSPEEVTARIDAKLQETNNLLFRLIEKQNKQLSDKQATIAILDRVMKNGQSGPVKLNDISTKIGLLSGFNSVFYFDINTHLHNNANNSTAVVNTNNALEHGRLQFLSPVMAHVWRTQRDAIIKNCKMVPTVKVVIRFA